jgi:hypothetical protein
MIKATKIGLLTAAVLIINLVGCNKEEGVIDVSQDLLDETTFAENIFEQLASDVDEVTFADVDAGARIADDPSVRRIQWLRRFGFSDCVEITREKRDDADFPIVITIDYGEGCKSWIFDVVKKGKIIITITGKMSEEGSQRIVTFERFHVNDNHIEGVFTFTNLGDASFSCTLVGGKITTPDGDEITRESERIRTRVRGGETDERRDDVYEITGNAYGKTINDVKYRKVITKPLIRSWACFWITSGTIETMINEETHIVIDFGDGECDNIATKSVNGSDPEEFEMNCRIKRWRWWKHPF